MVDKVLDLQSLSFQRKKPRNNESNIQNPFGRPHIATYIRKEYDIVD